MKAVEDILYSIIEREASTRASLIVAIDGRCAAGKTTLATSIARRLNANLIHMDDFFLRPEQRTKERLETPGENIDHERFLSEVLIPLHEQRPFSYRPFSCTTQALQEPIPILPGAVTLVEGSYACHPSLRGFFDLRIFLTVPPDEQMRRIRVRNGEQADVFRTRWIPLEEAYIAHCGVLECCHAVLDVSSRELQEKL